MYGAGTYIQQDLISSSSPVLYKTGMYLLKVIVLARRDTNLFSNYFNYNISLLANGDIIDNSLATVDVIPLTSSPLLISSILPTSTTSPTSPTLPVMTSTSNNLNIEGTVIIKLNIPSNSSLIGKSISVRITNNSRFPINPDYTGIQILVVNVKLATPDSCNNINLF
jgi:hypothetical protein